MDEDAGRPEEESRERRARLEEPEDRRQAEYGTPPDRRRTGIRESPDLATAGSAAAGVAVPAPAAVPKGRRRQVRSALLFLLPALVILGALVLYPILFSILRSLYDKGGDQFLGLRNYETMFRRPATLTAIKNNAIWVVVAPTLVTTLGLVFAVLTERVRWATAFKIIVFMPMAISALSAGVLWRLVYEQNPELGVANAAIRGVTTVLREPGRYPGARPSEEDLLRPEGRGFATSRTFSPGDTANLGLLAIAPDLVPDEARPARAPSAPSGSISGVVWLDFSRGGGGERGQVDPTEAGLPGVTVEAVRDGAVVASATTDESGAYTLEGLEDGGYTLRLPATNFREPFGGVLWLGPGLVTPSIIASYIWIWAGFAVVVIGAGLAAIPRDVLEAARVDGASEWQTFRRVTVPLLVPVLMVVFVTLIINVLKIFDLIFVIAPGSVQRDANVIALEMWRVSFGGGNDQGLGSALAVFLFLLVLPAMIFNLKRFKAEQ